MLFVLSLTDNKCFILYFRQNLIKFKVRKLPLRWMLFCRFMHSPLCFHYTWQEFDLKHKRSFKSTSHMQVFYKSVSQVFSNNQKIKKKQFAVLIGVDKACKTTIIWTSCYTLIHTVLKNGMNQYSMYRTQSLL